MFRLVSRNRSAVIGPLSPVTCHPSPVTRHLPSQPIGVAQQHKAPGTPAPVVNKLVASIGEVMKQPEVIRRMQELSVVGIGNTPAEFALFMKQERERWGRVVRETGAKAE